MKKAISKTRGLYVTLEAQANWKVLFDRVVSGELDGAHMLAAMPVGAATGSDYAIRSHSVHARTMVQDHRFKSCLAGDEKSVPMEDGKPKHPISVNTETSAGFL